MYNLKKDAEIIIKKVMITQLNRDGEPNVNVGLNFIGPAGTFRELPKASEITDEDYNRAARMTL
tara:strand:+ start:3784 stop:3975 length:192 start_codon:yes stop_codon:yes gene_type:complete